MEPWIIALVVVSVLSVGALVFIVGMCVGAGIVNRSWRAANFKEPNQ